MKGKVVSWKEDKGFGFIAATDQSEKVFFHISSVKKAVRKPQVGDEVVLEIGRDSQGRLKATRVLIEGVPLAESQSSNRIVTAPVSKDVLDYLLYVALIIFLAATVFGFLRTGLPESALVPGALFVIALFFLRCRKKQPSNKLFSCTRCRSVATHDHRTIKAWNRGIERLYCSACHQKWLNEHPREYADSTSLHSAPRTGCLGVFVALASLPVLCAVTAIKWFA